MADVGVIALDPLRLARLEGYLDGLDQGCRRRSGDVAETARLAGVAPPAAVGELDLVAAWCRRSVDEIRWRRAMLEDLPALPVPPFSFASRAAARSQAEALVERLASALYERPRNLDRIRRLLDEVARGTSSPTFVAALVDGLGPGRLAQLSALGADLGPSSSEAGIDADGLPNGAADEEADGSPRDLGEIRDLVERIVGADHPVVAWLDDLPPVVVDLAEASDELGDIGGNLWRAGRALRRRPMPRMGPLAVAAFGFDLVDAVRDPSDAHIWKATSSFLTMIAPVTGPAAPAVYFGAALCGLFSWLAATAAMSPSQRDDYERRYNPDTGESTYPSGSADSPWVDAGGVPLDPRFG